jgi:hypothetical protein
MGVVSGLSWPRYPLLRRVMSSMWELKITYLKGLLTAGAVIDIYFPEGKNHEINKPGFY